MGSVVETCNSATHLIAGNEEWLETKKHWINSWEKVKKNIFSKIQGYFSESQKHIGFAAEDDGVTFSMTRNPLLFWGCLLSFFRKFSFEPYKNLVRFVEIARPPFTIPTMLRTKCSIMFDHVPSRFISFIYIIQLIHKYLLNLKPATEMRCNAVASSTVSSLLHSCTDHHRSVVYATLCNIMINYVAILAAWRSIESAIIYESKDIHAQII